MTEAAFWDRIADKYAARPVQDQVAYEDWLSHARTLLGGEMTALEIGCGTGTTALKLAPSVGRITATDIAPRMVAIAQNKREEQGVENVEFAVAGMGASLPDGPFDAVMAFNLLHLVRDVPAALAEIARRVKPGGVFLSKTGLIGEAAFFIRPMIGVMRLFGKAPFVNSFDGDALAGMIPEAGFEVIESRTYEGMAPTAYIAARRL